VLQLGGNAADAAVAVAAALAVVDPSMTGLGGDMFALFFNGATKKVEALNGSGVT
jgi:gamma-glutamyltranspeptidase/glutathione hydrolase